MRLAVLKTYNPKHIPEIKAMRKERKKMLQEYKVKSEARVEQQWLEWSTVERVLSEYNTQPMTASPNTVLNFMIGLREEK